MNDSVTSANSFYSDDCRDHALTCADWTGQNQVLAFIDEFTRTKFLDFLSGDPLQKFPLNPFERLGLGKSCNF